MKPIPIPPIARSLSRFVPPLRWILQMANPPSSIERNPNTLLGTIGRGSVHRVKREMEKLAMASQLRGELVRYDISEYLPILARRH